MDIGTNPVKLRIACCRRQREKARTHIEQEAWRAEEEGLRDAALHRDHTDKYRERSPIILERYLIGFQDARALMRIAKVTQLRQSTGGRMS
ncbi:MAG: hypothetical protein KF747_16160 [Nitrospira sp.]|nr:hypothetical protein [Nitrospira sp.]